MYKVTEKVQYDHRFQIIFMKRNSFLRENNLEAVVILNFFCNFVRIKKTLKDSQKMEKENHIDRALAFMENLEKLGAQLQKADEQQKLMLQQMLTKSQNNETNTDEYRELEQRSKDLQAMINKWRPIYEERLKMVKEAQEGCKKVRLTVEEQDLRKFVFPPLKGSICPLLLPTIFYSRLQNSAYTNKLPNYQ